MSVQYAAPCLKGSRRFGRVPLHTTKWRVIVAQTLGSAGISATIQPASQFNGACPWRHRVKYNFARSLAMMATL